MSCDSSLDGKLDDVFDKTILSRGVQEELQAALKKPNPSKFVFQGLKGKNSNMLLLYPWRSRFCSKKMERGKSGNTDQTLVF